MRIEIFKSSHVDNFEIQDLQKDVNLNELRKFENLDNLHTYTGIIDDKTIVIAGVIYQYADKYYAWAVLSKDARYYMRSVTKAIQEFLISFKAERIEIHVPNNFPPGKRWAKILGFSEECFSRKSMPNGEDGFLYSIVKR